MSGAKKLIVGGAIGATIAYLFDPVSGRSRRAKTRDMLMARGRRSFEELGRKASDIEGKAGGALHTATTGETAPVDDVGLADRVRSEIFVGRSITPGIVNISAVSGIVTLRGQLASAEEIDDLVRATESVTGVEGVENLLHEPGEDAPNKRPAREASASQEASAPRTSTQPVAGATPSASTPPTDPSGSGASETDTTREEDGSATGSEATRGSGPSTIPPMIGED